MDAEAYVCKLIVDKCEGKGSLAIVMETELKSLPLGSLKVLEIISDIEAKYSFDIDEKTLFEISKVGDLIKLIEHNE
jgi:acyl carrier protein